MNCRDIAAHELMDPTLTLLLSTTHFYQVVRTLTRYIGRLRKFKNSIVNPSRIQEEIR